MPCGSSCSQDISELCDTAEAIFREEPTVLSLHGESAGCV